MIYWRSKCTSLFYHSGWSQIVANIVHLYLLYWGLFLLGSSWWMFILSLTLSAWGVHDACHLCCMLFEQFIIGAYFPPCCTWHENMIEPNGTGPSSSNVPAILQASPYAHHHHHRSGSGNVHIKKHMLPATAYAHDLGNPEHMSSDEPEYMRAGRPTQSASNSGRGSLNTPVYLPGTAIGWIVILNMAYLCMVFFFKYWCEIKCLSNYYL